MAERNSTRKKRTERLLAHDAHRKTAHDKFWDIVLEQVRSLKTTDRPLRVCLWFEVMTGADVVRVPSLFPYAETVGIMTRDSMTATLAQLDFDRAAQHDSGWKKVVPVPMGDPQFASFFDAVFMREE